MKPNELMIGDWVSLEDAPIQVESNDFIQEGTTYYTVDSQESLISKFNPIPLTEEILKANGFRDDGCEFIFKDDEVLIKIHKELKYISIINSEDYNYTTTKCKYTHELQHALRLCGLNELADNLKLK